jgi:uncharacterized protein
MVNSQKYVLGVGIVAIALVGQHWGFSWEFWIIGLVISVIGLMRMPPAAVPPSTQSNREYLLKLLEEVNKIIAKISDRPQQSKLQATAEQIALDLNQNLNQNQFTIAVFGQRGVGKTAVINALSAKDLTITTAIKSDKQLTLSRKISLIDTVGLGGSQNLEAVLNTAESADLVLFVTAGDLGAIAFQTLKGLGALKKRIILAFNKTDQFLPTDCELVVEELNHKTTEFLSPTDIVAIAANPHPITVRQYENCHEDHPHLIKEWLEPVPPDVDALKERIESILSAEGEALLFINIRQRLQRLHAQAETSLQKMRHAQAHKIIARYQWLSAGVIFATPIPAVDMIATMAINAKLLMELSQIYDRPLGLKPAQTMAMTMGEIFIKIGCVEVATVAIASQTSSLLKTNVATFAVGGTVQAVSAAYLTYVAGVSFLDYLDRTPELDFTPNMITKMTDICRANFLKMRDLNFIKDFVDSTISNLSLGNI